MPNAIVSSLTRLVTPDRTKQLKKRLMGDWPKGRELRSLLGAKAAEQVFDIVLESGIVKPQIAMKTNTDDNVLGTIDLFLELEIANCTRTMRTIHQAAGDKLTHGKFAALIGANTMPEANYGALPHESRERKAARWVCNASNTTRGNAAEIQIIEQIINLAVLLNTPMHLLTGVDTVNKLLIAGGGRTEARGPVVLPMASPLPSSPGGRAMLEASIRFIEGRTPGTHGCQWVDLGCYLLGAAIGCHGFPDANGRTGRVLYAICQVRSGGFAGLTTAGEELMHGLPHQ